MKRVYALWVESTKEKPLKLVESEIKALEGNIASKNTTLFEAFPLGIRISTTSKDLYNGIVANADYLARPLSFPRTYYEYFDNTETD